MTATTRTTECNPERTLYLAFELGSTKWTLGFTQRGAAAARVRDDRRGGSAGARAGGAQAKMRFGLPFAAPVQSCYEAGRDGFWLHRWLLDHGVANVVVDSSSIEVNRKARRAKTDRLDVRKLLALLVRWTAGERKAWSVVHVPSSAAENDRQLTRELEAVRDDRTRLRNRIHGLLATQGVRLSIDRRFETTLAAVQTGDGRPFPPALRARLAREWTHLQILEARMASLEAARDARIADGTDRVAQVARQLVTLRSVGEASAAVFSAEIFRHPDLPESAAARRADGARARSLSQRSARARPGDQQSRSRLAARSRDSDCVVLGALATGERADPLVCAALCAGGQTRAADWHCGARAQIDDRAVALRRAGRGPGGGTADAADRIRRARDARAQLVRAARLPSGFRRGPLIQMERRAFQVRRMTATGV